MNVIQLSSFAEFQIEIPIPRQIMPGTEPATPIVRLSLTETIKPNKLGISLKDICLDLMAANEHDEIVWLHYALQVNFDHEDNPFSDRDTSIYIGMQTMQDLVRNHLEATGYLVHGGRYGIPNDITPLRGKFEFVKWQKTDTDGLQVVLVNQED